MRKTHGAIAADLTVECLKKKKKSCCLIRRVEKKPSTPVLVDKTHRQYSHDKHFYYIYKKKTKKKQQLICQHKFAGHPQYVSNYFKITGSTVSVSPSATTA